MYNFKPRLTAPYDTIPSDVPYYFSSRNGYYSSGYGMPNCTAYAWGRVMELGDLNNKNITPDGFLGNGGKWGDSTYLGQTWTKGTTPKLGAIAVWTEYNEAGHVGVVEQINDDGSYVCSNSGYYRPVDINNWHYFFITNCTKDNVIYYNGSIWGNYLFRYFLYPPYIDETPTPPQPTPESKKKSIIPLMLCNALPNTLFRF